MSGSLHRIDYILIPEDWFGGGCRTWVDKSLDPNNSCIDHWALVAEVSVPGGCSSQVLSWRRIDYDLGAAQRGSRLRV